MSNRAQQRREIVNFLYHHFLMGYSLSNTKDFFLKKKQFNDWQTQILQFAFQNWTQIIALITKNLDEKWTFEAISNLEKSILVVAIAEYFSQITPYEIAIAEAVKQVENLGSYRAHTYVNRVLELIFREKMN